MCPKYLRNELCLCNNALVYVVCMTYLSSVVILRNVMNIYSVKNLGVKCTNHNVASKRKSQLFKKDNRNQTHRVKFDITNI